MSFPSVSAKTVMAPLVFALLSSVSLAAETIVDLPDGIKGTLALPDSGATGQAVIMLHGFGSSRDEVGGLFAMQAAANGVADMDLGWRTISLKQDFLDSVARHDLAARFAGYNGPFLTIAGEADPATAYFDQYVGLAAGKTETLVIPGADHMLGVFSEEPEIGREVIAKTTAWLADTL